MILLYFWSNNAALVSIRDLNVKRKSYRPPNFEWPKIIFEYLLEAMDRSSEVILHVWKEH